MKEDIGKLVHEAMERAERKPQWLARKIGCDRTNIYDIFKRKDISISMLWRISLALKHNLLKELSQQLDDEMENNEC